MLWSVLDIAVYFSLSKSSFGVYSTVDRSLFFIEDNVTPLNDVHSMSLKKYPHTVCLVIYMYSVDYSIL